MKKNSQYTNQIGGLIKKTTIAIFLVGLLTVSNQSTGLASAITLQQKHKHRIDMDDDDDGSLTQTNAEDGDEKKNKKAKFDETMALMSKYDKAEAHVKWLASPEYAKIQEAKEAKAEKSSSKSYKTAKEKEAEDEVEATAHKEQEENALALVEKEKRDKEIKKKKDVQFKQKTIKQYLTKLNEDSDAKIITKDRAFIAAGKFLEHFRDMRGHKKTQYLEDNFKTTWGKHDEKHQNYIMQEDAPQFFDEIMGEIKPDDDSNVQQVQEDQEI